MPPNPFRTGFVATADDGVELTFAKLVPGHWSLTYRPASRAIEIASRIDPKFRAPKGAYTLIKCDTELDVVTTRPLNTTATSRGFLGPKYDSLSSITFEGFRFSDAESVEDVVEALSGLPSGFVKDPYFGLGLNYDIRHIIESLEDVKGLSDLRIRKGRGVGLPKVENGTYTISAISFDRIRKTIRRIHDRALNVAIDEKHVFAHNELLHPVDPITFPITMKKYRKDAVAEAGDGISRPQTMTATDRKVAAAATSANARTMSRKEPRTLLALSRTIETVTLEGLIDQFESMLSKRLSEAAWQTFLSENPFILKMAFGYPVIKIGEQFSVGGRKFSGSGDKIADFAFKAAASGNIALIEIKTPDTELLEARAYRGGLFGPHREVSGAVNQVLDQRYQLQRNLANLKDASGVRDVESYAVQGMVIAGRTPSERDSLKSLELFRNGLKSVSVVTFDELLGKLQFLLEVFRGSSAEDGVEAIAASSENDGTEEEDADLTDLEVISAEI